MQIVFVFESGRVELEIDLCDNPVVKQWYNLHVSDFNMEAFFTDNGIQKHRIDYDICTNLLNQIKTDLNSCQQYGLKTDLVVPSTMDDLDQLFCNKLHRYFTESCRLICMQRNKQWQDIKKNLENINDNIHTLEMCMDTPVKRQLTPNLFREICINKNTDMIDKNQWMALTEEDRKHHSASHYDVILGPHILGKSLWKSYIDDDDPNHWDTSGHYFCTEGLHIIINQKSREDVYNSKHFRKWLNRYGLKKNVYYDFPIGNIRNKKNLANIVDKMNKKPRHSRFKVIFQK